MNRKKVLRQSGKTVDFAASSDLKSLFLTHYEKWTQTHSGGLDELARRCGVSPAYLAHVRRYGRIPSIPVLILLALNFDMDSPRELFRAAKSDLAWPYGSDIALTRRERTPSGFLSLKLDMEGFTGAIREIVRSEVRQRSLMELTKGRPLRIGYNHTQGWMFAGGSRAGPLRYNGIFPELCEMLSLALRHDVETIDVPFAEYVTRLEKGEIDLFGPLMAAPYAARNIQFSLPLYRLGVATLFRARATDGLELLEPPTHPDQLRDSRIKIAVLRHSFPHILALTRLQKNEDSLVVCDSDEEAFDRVLLRGLRQPAHAFMLNGILAKRFFDQHPTEVKLIFNKPGELVDLADNAIAGRPDWPELISIVNESLRFLLSRGALTERFSRLLGGEFKDFVQPL